MYSKLRHLVLEYLGIPPTPIKQSSDETAPSYSVDDGAVAPSYRYAERRGQSAPLPTRCWSWSRPSLSDSSEVTRANMTKSPPPARGSVVS